MMYRAISMHGKSAALACMQQASTHQSETSAGTQIGDRHALVVQWCIANYGSSTLPSVEYIYILVSWG